MNILELSEQEIGRRQSLQELRDMGIDPYPAAEYPGFQRRGAFTRSMYRRTFDEQTYNG